MNERRVALVPVVVDHSNIDKIFEDVKSPAPIRILSSCDIEVRMFFFSRTVFIYQRPNKVGCVNKSGCSLHPNCFKRNKTSLISCHNEIKLARVLETIETVIIIEILLEV